MLSFFRKLWNVITFPFRWTGNLIARPFRAVYRFMMTEPSSLPLGDILTAILTEKNAQQALIDEIEKFRGHLLRSVAFMFIAGMATWAYINPIVDFLARPIGGQEALQAIDLTEGIGVYMKVIFAVALAVSVIYIAFELWLFAAPGLTVKERWATIAIIPLSAILFITGAAVTYYLLLPPSIYFLQNVGNFQSNPSANTYYSLVTRLLVWIGLFFEFPLITTLLTWARIITPKALLSQWRLAIVIIGLIAAIITPTTDWGSMAIVMAPMTVLYFISIGLSFLVYRQKKEENITES